MKKIEELVENEPEIWRKIEGFDYDYEVSNLGNVRCLNNKYRKSTNGLNFRQSKDLKGYMRVGLIKDGVTRTIKTHRLVAKYFLENYSEELTVNHIDFDKTNNKVSNLEMMTFSENVLHYQNSVNEIIGVKKHKNLGKYTVRVTHLGTRRYLGTYETEEEAKNILERWNETQDISMFKIGKGGSNVGKSKYSREDLIRYTNRTHYEELREIAKNETIGTTQLLQLIKKEKREAEKLKHLHNLILEWGYNKKIIQANNPIAQCNKTFEEVNELKDAIESNNKEEIKDAIADSIITLMLQAEIQGLSLEDCLESAYNIISKRTGKIVDGQFIKDK